MTIAVDSFGPVTDNAQSVYELSRIESRAGIAAEIERDFRFRPDFESAKLQLEKGDGAGNTFKATAKPVLIGTATEYDDIQLHLFADSVEQVVMVPKVGGESTVDLETTIFRPAGDGPFPLVVINHGKSPGKPTSSSQWSVTPPMSGKSTSVKPASSPGSLPARSPST